MSRLLESPEAFEFEAEFPTGGNVSDNFEAEAFFLPRRPPCRSLPYPSEANTSQPPMRRPKLSMEFLMSIAIRRASNAIVTAALLYKEFAISASDLLRPGTYLNR